MTTFRSSLGSESSAEHYCHKVHRVVPMVISEKIPKYSKSLFPVGPALTPIAHFFWDLFCCTESNVGNMSCSCGISLGCSATENKQSHAYGMCGIGCISGFHEKVLLLDSDGCYCVR